MLVYIDVSDLNLSQDTLFQRLEPILMYGAIDFCGASHKLTRDEFELEMIDFFYDNRNLDDTEEESIINDLDQSEFQHLVELGFVFYQRVTEHFKHIWNYEALKETILVYYTGNQRDRIIEVEITLDAPAHLIAAYHNRNLMMRNKPIKLNYIPLIENSI